MKERSQLAQACLRLCQSSLCQTHTHMLNLGHSARLQAKSSASVDLNHAPASTNNLRPPQCHLAIFAIFTSSPELHSLKGNLYLTSEICQNRHLTWAAYCDATSILGSCPELLLSPTQPHISSL